MSELRTIAPEELTKILSEHLKWLRGEDGSRANLSFANLRYTNLNSADLRYANLSYIDLRYTDLNSADLRSADLSYTDLNSTNLSYTNLRYANLRFANLRYADLNSVKEDFFARLDKASGEVVGLYDYIMKGKINGNVYVGECACFVGSIATLRKENYAHLTCDLKPDSNSLTEIWFLAIATGDTPSNNQASKITAEWIREYSELNKIKLPEYKIVSSFEAPEAFEIYKLKKGE